MAKPVKIALTMGDPAGIGPEIILKAYRQRLPLHIPIVFGDGPLFHRLANSLPSPPIRVVSALDSPLFTSREGVNLFSVTELPQEEICPGRVSAATGKAAGQYIEAAIQAALRGEVDAVVTCPIHKKAFHAGGYPYPGHTEMFAALTGTRRYGMMMASPALTVALATIHLPLREVPGHLTKDRLSEILSLTLDTMRQWFGIPNPRICVLGLNPHAGESGEMGTEEAEIIEPALAPLRDRGVQITGPLPADTAFTRPNLKRFDAFVAMYHDQGLIPFKLLAFETGVNLTMGLPFPRVSVDHGTALDIAGKGIADPSSLRSAIRWAVRFAKTKR